MLTLPTSIGDAAYQVIHRQSFAKELTETTVPVLAIAGAQDHAYPPPLSSVRLAAAAPTGRNVTVAGAGHSVALEDPDAVAGHLRRHFAAAS
jgi:3-oxoadipate enol-lactonase